MPTTTPASPMLTATQVADLLGATDLELEHSHPGLLYMRLDDGSVAYPAFQFDGNQPVPGVRRLVLELVPLGVQTEQLATWLLDQPEASGSSRRLSCCAKATSTRWLGMCTGSCCPRPPEPKAAAS